MPRITYKISEIASIVEGELFRQENADDNITELLLDSRRLTTADNCLFIAIVSKKNDGHKYISELFNKGIRSFIVSDKAVCPEGSNCIYTENTLKALHKLTAFHRKKFSIPVIGITGSNGKTIVKEWLYQLLNPDKRVVRSPKSYNSQIGVPLSVWQLTTESEIGIFEAGISEPDEMEKLQRIISPTIGIFTNIGPAHSENFISIRQKVGEKLKLFTKVKTLIYCPDYAEIQETIIKSQILDDREAFTWSRKQEADLQIKKVVHENHQTTISGIYRKKEVAVTIPFTDEASTENAIHCWATLFHLGYDNKTIASRMLTLQSIAMRMEMKEGINHCSIINDSYNSDFVSLGIAIDFLNQQNQHRKKTIILSDILQSGQDDDELYGEIGILLKKKNINKIIGIGSAINKQQDKFDLEKYFYPTTEAFLRQYSFAAFQNESILLKGARMFEFEQISHALQQKAHETVLEINLNALVSNLGYFRRKLNPETKIMAMVKAFSYGSGSFEIANILQYHRIDYLAVAYTDEGVELRKAGIIVPIMIMNPDQQSFDSIIKHDLEPEIYSFRSLDLLEEAIRTNIIVENKPVKIHIKIDTGMHRLGFMPDETDKLIDQLKNINTIFVKSVFSHLAASEDAGEDDFTRQQIRLFTELTKKFRKEISPDILAHILNSAGISRFPEAQMDMVRLGISLYGVASTEDDLQNLENVSMLKSIISQIKIVQAGETIGYNRAGKADKEMTIAIVPVGYADGLNRKLSNGKGKLFIKGYSVPITGNVCMDMCMVDITGIDANEGDEVIIFGKEHPITELAHDLETIPYEVLTNISRRVKRVYFHE
jgi:Alr-MurF fusion protein